MNAREQNPRSTAIDFESIRRTVSLRDVIARDLGSPHRGDRWVCPFHVGAENPNFSVTKDGRSFRCWSCGAKGDLFDYVAQRDGVSVAEAARQLDPLGDRKSAAPHRPPTRAKIQAAPTRPAAWEDPAWQAALDEIVVEGQANLWAAAGREAIAWLRDRGLEDSTIRRFRLGFLPRGAESVPLEALADARGKAQPIRASRGVTIPWGHPAGAPSWVGCQVRRLNPDFTNPEPKYLAVRGSERGHAYPHNHAIAGLPALVCEGEFDALLGWQELGAAVNVLTVGGVSQNPQPDAMELLHASPAWLLAFDHDENQAGDNAARKFSGLAPHKCRRLWLPGTANDLTEFRQGGGSLLEWLASEFARFGWAWPSVPIAADASAWRARAAALPWSQWQAWRRRSAEMVGQDGSVEAIQAAERLALDDVLQATRGGSR
jgi:DNA primase